MPEFETYVDVDVDEFVSACSKREIKELIEVLIEGGHISSSAVEDTEKTIGVLAQEVEAHIPELINNDGFGETPADGIPLKTIYQTDLQYVLMRCIQELSAKVTALEAA